MSFASLRRLFARTPLQALVQPSRAQHPFRPYLEHLEARDLLSSYNIGDVFVGLDSRINHYGSKGNFIESIPAAPDVVTGMAFDAAGNLFATNFQDASVQKFDRNLN